MMIYKRSDVQGLRAIAVIAVIAFHAGLPIPGGFTGVDVFFVISGFVITSSILREWLETGNFEVGRFYFRRFKRLAPALALVVVFTMAASVVFFPPLRSYMDVAALTGLGALLFSANVVISFKTGDYFQPRAADNPLLHTWSLSVEEQFYIIFPALLLFSLLLKKPHRKPVALSFIGVLALVSLAALFFHMGGISNSKIEKAIGFYSPISRAWEFSFGTLLAFLPKIQNRIISNVLFLVGTALLAFSFWGISAGTQFPGLATFLPVVGAMVLLVAGSLEGRCWAQSLLASPFLAATGDCSYSLYLWHWPIIVFAGTMFGQSVLVLSIGALLSVIPAVLAYRFVETPIRRSEPASYAKKLKLIAQTGLPGLAACVFLLFANHHGYWSPSIQKFQAGADPEHIGLERGCGTGYVPYSIDDRTCAFGPSSANPPLYLIGDSNADHFSEAVIAAGLAANRPVRIFTKGGCAFMGKSWSNASDAELHECQDYVQGTLEFLDTAPKGSVILGLSDSNWRGDAAVGDDRQSETRDPAKKLEIMDRDLIGSINRIQRAGHDVTLLKPVAKFIAEDRTFLFDYKLCSAFSVWQGKCPSKVVVSKTSVLAAQKQTREALSRVASITGAATLDMLPVYCPGESCENISDDGTLLYRDPGHLSVKADAISNPVFLAWVRSHQKN